MLFAKENHCYILGVWDLNAKYTKVCLVLHCLWYRHERYLQSFCCLFCFFVCVLLFVVGILLGCLVFLICLFVFYLGGVVWFCLFISFEFLFCGLLFLVFVIGLHFAFCFLVFYWGFLCLEF